MSLATAHAWHMRAAEWLRTRDIVAARSSWERARSIAERLPDEHQSVVEMRIAPRKMLAWTDWLVGADPDADASYEELRALATQSGDTLSLAMGTAGRAFALCENEHRPAEAAALADDVLQMIDDVHCDAMLKVDLLFAVMWAKFLVADHRAVLRTGEQIRELAGNKVNSSVARANAVCGVSPSRMGRCRGRSARTETRHRAGEGDSIRSPRDGDDAEMWADRVRTRSAGGGHTEGCARGVEASGGVRRQLRPCGRFVGVRNDLVAVRSRVRANRRRIPRARARHDRQTPGARRRAGAHRSRPGRRAGPCG